VKSGSFVLIVLLLSASLCAAGSPPSKSAGQPTGNEMAVDIYSGYLVVAPGSVNGFGNLRFLLDTGTANSVIDRAVAQKLGLRGEATKITSFDKFLAAEWTEVREITFGPEHIFGKHLMIEDLSYLRSAGAQVDGLIGLDILRQQSFVLDYARRRIIFGQPASTGMVSVPFRADETSISVEVYLDGRPVRMMADTGVRSTVFFADALRDQFTDYRVQRRSRALSVAGAVEDELAVVPRLSIGGHQLDREVVVVSAPRTAKLTRVSGCLGLASLDAKQVAFDFETNRLLWSK
jgi:predicted aspartyl protease